MGRPRAKGLWRGMLVVRSRTCCSGATEEVQRDGHHQPTADQENSPKGYRHGPPWAHGIFRALEAKTREHQGESYAQPDLRPPRLLLLRGHGAMKSSYQRRTRLLSPEHAALCCHRRWLQCPPSSHHRNRGAPENSAKLRRHFHSVPVGRAFQRLARSHVLAGVRAPGSRRVSFGSIDADVHQSGLRSLA